MKKHTRKVRTAVLLAILLITLTGCTEARETMIQMRQELRQEIALEDPAGTDTQENTEQQRLEVPSVNDIVNDDITIEETYEPVRTMGTPVQEITVALYFADADREELVKTEKRIPKVEGMARATIETLLEGPEAGSELVSIIPAGTQLLDINVKAEEKKCIVDFSHELLDAVGEDNIPDDALESIARTLRQFDSIETVEFRIEGKPVVTLKNGS